MGRRTNAGTEARRGGLAVLVAAGLHLGLILALGIVDAPEAPTLRGPLRSEDQVSIELIPTLESRAGAKRRRHASAGPEQSEAVAAARSLTASARRSAVASSGGSPSVLEWPTAGSIEPGPSTASSAKPDRRPVNLGLGGKTRSSLLLASRGRDTMRRPRESVGMLREGLAELDARRGLGPAGAAASAASRAASAVGPSRGIAVFDVRTDAKGLVTGVTLVGFGSNAGAWSAVARRMATSLRGRRLPLARSSRGTLTRLQVAVGQEAKPAAGTERTKRGAALGQGSRSASDVARDESTRAIMNGPTPSPTLGKKVVGASSARRVRVSVLSTSQLGG